MKSIDAPTRRVRVWDLPTRLFHWALVALIAFSWWSAEEQHLEWHIWSGLAILTLLLFRLLWGIFGSSTARFASFVRGPGEVLAYVRDLKGWRGTGHNPLGALSVLALLILISLQVATGLVNIDDDGLVEGPLAPLVSFELSEAAHDVHHQLFDILLLLIGLHVAAVIFYRLFLGRKLTKAMITGVAELDPQTEPMRPGKWWVALLCLVSAIAVAGWVMAGAPPFAP